MTVRPARDDELSRVFRLTYDLGAGGSVTRHVVACKRDRKLRSGTHFVLEDDRGEFVSTLTVYVYRHPPVATAVGLANVFTPEPLRGRGYASRLIEGTLAHLGREERDVFYLLSDIGGDFYARFGFRPLPLRYEAAPDCLPMLRCPPADWDRLSTHGPFLRGLMAFVD
ncbi:MAG TPA: GNAT family N-acetyltransferase [Planctomycetaceae bacterium]